MPARKLQLIGQIALRQVLFIAQLADLSPMKLFKTSFFTGSTFSCLHRNFGQIQDKMTFRLILYAVTFFHCSLIEQNSFRAHFLFLPKFRSLGCYEIITTFHSLFGNHL
jgi:hypothetical protein